MRAHHLRGRSLSVLPAALGLAVLLGSVAPGCEAEDPASRAEDAPRAGDVTGSLQEDPLPMEPLEGIAYLERNDEAPELAPELRSRVEAAGAGAPLLAGGVPIQATQTLPSVYDGRGFEPIWVLGAALTSHGRTLLDELRQAEDDGLDPAHYHLATLDSLVSRLEADDGAEAVQDRADVELLLTDAFLLYGSHLLHGRLDPLTVEPHWTATRNGVDMAQVLEEALAGDGVSAALEGLRPGGDRYPVLQQALAHYRAVARAGGWESVPVGEVLDPGMRDPRVVALRARLAASAHLGDRVGEGADPELYDEALADVVRAFQRHHGLEPDGRVGRATLAALNVPAAERHQQLLVNLERWRWLPRDMGDRYILVNIPGFTASVVDHGEETFRLRTIVGRHYRQTPVFSGRMTYLALAPYWNVPPGIAANDQLPQIRENPDHVTQQGMVLFENATNRAVDPHSVDWSGVTGAEFNRRFRLRQNPGPANALGDVKFMFPNRHNVYLHDTPGRELFDRTARDFSSGCVRVERALELAAHLLQDDPSWTRERIQRVVQGGREQAVTLPRPYMVHLQYWTAWVEADGEVHFRDDLYRRDGRVREALERPPPRGL